MRDARQAGGAAEAKGWHGIVSSAAALLLLQSCPEHRRISRNCAARQPRHAHGCVAASAPLSRPLRPVATQNLTPCSSREAAACVHLARVPGEPRLLRTSPCTLLCQTAPAHASFHGRACRCRDSMGPARDASESEDEAGSDSSGGRGGSCAYSTQFAAARSTDPRTLVTLVGPCDCRRGRAEPSGAGQPVGGPQEGPSSGRGRQARGVPEAGDQELQGARA